MSTHQQPIAVMSPSGKYEGLIAASYLPPGRRLRGFFPLTYKRTTSLFETTLRDDDEHLFEVTGSPESLQAIKTIAGLDSSHELKTHCTVTVSSIPCCADQAADDIIRHWSQPYFAKDLRRALAGSETVKCVCLDEEATKRAHEWLKIYGVKRKRAGVIWEQRGRILWRIAGSEWPIEESQNVLHDWESGGVEMPLDEGPQRVLDDLEKAETGWFESKRGKIGRC